MIVRVVRVELYGRFVAEEYLPVLSVKVEFGVLMMKGLIEFVGMSRDVLQENA